MEKFIYGIEATNLILVVLAVLIPRRVPSEIKLIVALFFFTSALYHIKNTGFNFEPIISIIAGILWIIMYKWDKKN